MLANVALFVRPWNKIAAPSPDPLRHVNRHPCFLPGASIRSEITLLTRPRLHVDSKRSRWLEKEQPKRKDWVTHCSRGLQPHGNFPLKDVQSLYKLCFRLKMPADLRIERFAAKFQTIGQRGEALCLECLCSKEGERQLRVTSETRKGRQSAYPNSLS